ncbi:MAG: hypothetical protein RLZZ458_139 [Planctomycetota bacterium]
MIRNNDELKIVREQLARAEAALESLRNDVLPKSRQMYQVMAEPCIDTIVELRGQIDTYLEIVTVPESADIVISLEGDRVGLGRTSAAAVTRVIDTFRRGLQSAVEIQESIRRCDTSRRRDRWVEAICDLPLVGTTAGSVRIMLGEPQTQNLFRDEERAAFHQALTLIFDGLVWADIETSDAVDHPFNTLHPDTKQAMLGLLTRLLPPRTGDIERISFLGRNAESSAGFRRATLTRGSRDRIRRAIEALSTDTKFVELEGVIRSVDLDAQTFALRDRADNQPDLQCEYGSDLEAAVKTSLDCRVIVNGSLETSQKTKKSKLLADSIEFVAEEPATSETTNPN